MVLYTCPRCKKEFTKKDNFIKHTEKKKKQCVEFIENNNQKLEISPNKNGDKIKLVENFNEPINNLECRYCLKIFSRIDSLERHQNGRCKILNAQNEEKRTNIIDKFNSNLVNIEELNVDPNTKLILTLLFNQNKKLIENMNQILEENKEFKETIKKLDKSKSSKDIINTNNSTNTNTNTNSHNTTNNTTNTNSNNTQINNTINIIAHGKEDLSDIELETIMTCLSTYKHKEIIPNITKHIYLNEDKPENQNFCITDMSRNKCKYHNGNKWMIGKSNDKIVKIFDSVHNVLTEPFEKENIEKTTAFIRANPKKFNAQFIKVANHYLTSLYDEEDKESMEDKAKVLEELKLIFFNNKDEILRIKLKDEKKKIK